MTPSGAFSGLFAPEPADEEPSSAGAPWKVLLVDDEDDIHAVFRLALQDVRVEGRSLRLLDARSAAEARAQFAEHPDIALVLLDVVMDTGRAGLDFARHVRGDLGNRCVQIVLVTGQPGYAPQHEVVADYEIDGYRLKSELTADKIFVVVYPALRNHRVLLELDRHRHDLESLVRERTLELSVARDAAESASRAKSVFLANMSHELRTPLNGMLGMAGLALRRATDPKQKEHLELLERSTRQLVGLVDDVLDIANLESDRLALERGEFRLADVVAGVVSRVAPVAESKALALDLDLDPGATERLLLGDAARLGQALSILMGNAVKFTEAGSVALRVPALEESPAGVLASFEVRDTGIGIAAEDHERIFRPFEQADGSSTRRFQGAGLGLAIARRLARTMGGDITIDSRAGEGSTFRLEVRLAGLEEGTRAGDVR